MTLARGNVNIKSMEPKKLLVVEDDLYLKDLYCEILSDAGYYVESASDGEDALDKISKGGWDLILLDIVMPKLDGISVVKRMKEITSEKPNGKVVFLTNLGKGEDIKEALNHEEAVGYLIKSQFTPDQLVAEINSFLNTLKS